MDRNKISEFSEIDFEKPLFYKCDVGLRFEIGPENIELWKNYDLKILNPEYFEEAFKRAFCIFTDAFSPDDNISIVYQIFSDGRKKIRKGNFIFKQIKNLSSREIKFSDHRDIYTDELDFSKTCWKRVKISKLKLCDVNVKNILEAMINTDFSIRQPSLPGECFFINHDKDMMLNLYDDRGIDIIASQKEVLNPLYDKYNSWILDYDKKKIEAVFG